jgi:predicted nucleotidyltransferase
MNASIKKYPPVWYQERQRKYHQLEKARLNTIDAIKKALNHLEKRYIWDDAYIFGSVTSTGRYRSASDVDIALSGLDKFDYFAFIGDISELLNKRVDVVRLEECRFSQSIISKGIKWTRKKI